MRRSLSYFVHHETTFDHEEVRRHLTALLLTPTRLVIAHTDEHPGDDMLPEPYTSTTTEAVTLTSIRTVVVTRMVANPTAGVAPPAEAVLTIGWGGVGRLDLEPAACSDPELRRRPRLHRHARRRRLQPARLRRRRGRRTRSPDCWPSPTRCRRGPAGERPTVTMPASGRASPSPPTVERSLADVIPAVARALGVPLAGHPGGLELPPAPSYVVFLVDGMGAELLARHGHAAPYLSSLARGRARPARPGVPSTTATSLASLGTGLVPGAHGLVGFTARIPGTDRLLNHLGWDRGVDPVEWQPHPTAFGRLAAAGVHVTSVNKRDFDGSGLTVASQRGATYVGADRVGERIAAAVSASADQPSLTYVYDSDLDWTGHKFGVASTQWLQQLAMVDAEAEQLREALPPSTRLLVVADHGMVDSPRGGARRRRRRSTGCATGSALIGGEARFRHLYCAAGAVDDVVATWREVLGDRATVLTREDVDRPRLVRRGRPAGAAAARRRDGRLPRRRRGGLDARLRLRGHPGRAARLPDLGRDADPHPGGLSLVG